MKMQICKRCYLPMIGVMSFSNERHEQFCRCPNCNSETRHQEIRDNELSFGEVLDKELHKGRYKNGRTFC